MPPECWNCGRHLYRYAFLDYRCPNGCPRDRPTLPQDARTGGEAYGDMAPGEIVPYTGHDAGHSEEGAG